MYGAVTEVQVEIKKDKFLLSWKDTPDTLAVKYVINKHYIHAFHCKTKEKLMEVPKGSFSLEILAEKCMPCKFSVTAVYKDIPSKPTESNEIILTDDFSISQLWISAYRFEDIVKVLSTDGINSLRDFEKLDDATIEEALSIWKKEVGYNAAINYVPILRFKREVERLRKILYNPDINSLLLVSGTTLNRSKVDDYCYSKLVVEHASHMDKFVKAGFLVKEDFEFLHSNTLSLPVLKEKKILELGPLQINSIKNLFPPKPVIPSLPSIIRKSSLDDGIVYYICIFLFYFNDVFNVFIYFQPFIEFTNSVTLRSTIVLVKDTAHHTGNHDLYLAKYGVGKKDKAYLKVFKNNPQDIESFKNEVKMYEKLKSKYLNYHHRFNLLLLFIYFLIIIILYL